MRLSRRQSTATLRDQRGVRPHITAQSHRPRPLAVVLDRVIRVSYTEVEINSEFKKLAMSHDVWLPAVNLSEPQAVITA
jgi:hypothetical protein